MEKQKVDMYVMNNAKYFDSSSIPFIRQRLESMSDESFMTLQSIEFKDPTTLLIISILVGSLGVDRFMSFKTFNRWMLWSFNYYRLVFNF